MERATTEKKTNTKKKKPRKLEIMKKPRLEKNK